MRDEGFEVAFDTLFPRAQRLAQRILGDPDAAEDVAAEAMARAYARWQQLENAPWRDGWVLKVTANLAIDATRRKRPLIGRPVDRDAEDAAAIRITLVAALRALSRRQREVIVLRYLSGLDEAEIATSLGISAGSVKTHTHRGLAALRARLGPDLEETSLAL